MSGQPPIGREEWAKTDVAKASTIACGWCGARFESPHDFYAHLDAEHPKKKAQKESKGAR